MKEICIFCKTDKEDVDYMLSISNVHKEDFLLCIDCILFISKTAGNELIKEHRKNIINKAFAKYCIDEFYLKE